MLKSRLLTLVFLCAGALLASPLEVEDPFQSPGDVVGDPMLFDIRAAMVIFNPDSMTITIDTNYQDKQLTPIQVNGVELNVGDLLFEVNGVPHFGIPVVNHDGLEAGHLYMINDVSTGLLTAFQVIAYPDASAYRPDAWVWMQSVNGSLTDITESGGNAAKVKVEDLGDGTTGPKYRITINTAFQAAYGSALGAVNGVYFASATCGNDILEGSVPEPGSVVLIGGGLAALGLLGRRFRRR
jgi:hypothetical protein